MGITYRQGNDGRLTVAQMDDNFQYLEDQLAGLTNSGSGATGPSGPTGPAGFGTTGAISFPFLPGNQRTGSGDNLQFEKGEYPGNPNQKIISTADGTESYPTVERLVISGGDSYKNGLTYSGEGGDIYLWAGKGQDGGDIKVDAGNGISSGGTVKIRGGYTETGSGGFIQIIAGDTSNGPGGDVYVNAGNGYGNGNDGGDVFITSGYGSNTGGNITLNAQNGGTAGGNVTVTTGGAERMRITNDGKIGIGTNSPTAALDVNGDVNITGDITSLNLFCLKFITGNIGIGTTPSVALDVVGDVNITGVITSTSSMILKPDSSLSTDQYIVLDPTAGVIPHIHIRAGGDIDNSTTDLFIGGEQNNLRVSDVTNTVEIRTNGTASWQFAATGITYPDNTIQTTADSRPYKVYTALLTQSGGDNPQSIYEGELTIGVTYLINGDAIGDGCDFTNVGAPNNNQGTYFVASGTTPNWNGTINPDMLTYNLGAPTVPIVLENTIGNIWFTYETVGHYQLNSNGLFSSHKSCVVHSGTTSDDGGSTTYFVYSSVIDYTYVKIFITDTTGYQEDNALGNYLIEIRVYN
jgi:hypothetical protein